MVQTQRKKPLQILHLAMPKTGSVSMMAAYQELGYTTYHGFQYMAIGGGPAQIAWERAIDAKWYGKGKPFAKEDFDELLGEYEVLSDFPVVGFSEELLEMYPEAKIVLVDRDIYEWYKSFNEGVIAANFTWIVRFMRAVLEPYFTKAHPAISMWKLETSLFDCHDEESWRMNAGPTYRKHYAKVRSLVPKERLLNYKLGSGWKPLCDFLDKPIPDCEFPHKNEKTEFAIWMHKTQVRVLKDGLSVAFWKLGVPGVVLAAVYAVFAAISLY